MRSLPAVSNHTQCLERPRRATPGCCVFYLMESSPRTFCVGGAGPVLCNKVKDSPAPDSGELGPASPTRQDPGPYSPLSPGLRWEGWADGVLVLAVARWKRGFPWLAACWPPALILAYVELAHVYSRRGQDDRRLRFSSVCVEGLALFLFLETAHWRYSGWPLPQGQPCPGDRAGHVPDREYSVTHFMNSRVLFFFFFKKIVCV